MCLYASEFGVPTVSLRYFTVYGPRQRPEMAFHRFIKAGLTGQEIEVYGDGEQSRDFTFIDDIVTANLLAAEKGVVGEMYNIGGGEVVTINQVLDIIAEHIGPLQVNRKERQKGDARHTSAEVSKAKRDLGFSPETTVRQGLAHEISWLREVTAV
jgi:UDP-glucose 4-epimerase